MNPKRIYTKGDLPGLLLPVPRPCGEPLPTNASTGGPPTPAGGNVQYPVRSLLLSSGSWCTKVLFVPPRPEFLFPLVLWKSYNQIQPAFKVRFPGDSHPLLDPQAGEPDVGSEPSQQYENFCGVIVVKFVGHPPSRYGI